MLEQLNMQKLEINEQNAETSTWDSLKDVPFARSAEHKHKDHEHKYSHSPAFEQARETALKYGQEAVGDEKRQYPLSGQITEQVKSGQNVQGILKNATQTGVWNHIDEFIKNGATIEEVHNKLGKGVMWLAIDDLVEHGDDIDKIADKIDDTAIWLNADKFVKYGANLDRLRARLSKDEYLKSLIDRGELFPDQPKE